MKSPAAPAHSRSRWPAPPASVRTVAISLGSRILAAVVGAGILPSFLCCLLLSAGPRAGPARPFNAALKERWPWPLSPLM